MIHFFGMKRKAHCAARSVMLIGKRGTGKSTALTMIAEEARNMGYAVYSNYPIDYTIKMPMKKLKDGRIVLDKSFLYQNPKLEHCYILLDEAEDIWNNRAWGKWTEADSEFINYLRKADIYLFVAVQNFDNIDVNVIRKLEATWFLKPCILPSFTVVECALADTCKVESLTSAVLDAGYRQVEYKTCEMPDGTYLFYRKPYYSSFISGFRYMDSDKIWTLENWHDIAFSEVVAEDDEEQRLDSVLESGEG